MRFRKYQVTTRPILLQFNTIPPIFHVRLTYFLEYSLPCSSKRATHTCFFPPFLVFQNLLSNSPNVPAAVHGKKEGREEILRSESDSLPFGQKQHNEIYL